MTSHGNSLLRVSCSYRETFSWEFPAEIFLQSPWGCRGDDWDYARYTAGHRGFPCGAPRAPVGWHGILWVPVSFYGLSRANPGISTLVSISAALRHDHYCAHVLYNEIRQHCLILAMTCVRSKSYTWYSSAVCYDNVGSIHGTTRHQIYTSNLSQENEIRTAAQRSRRTRDSPRRNKPRTTTVVSAISSISADDGLVSIDLVQSI